MIPGVRPLLDLGNHDGRLRRLLAVGWVKREDMLREMGASDDNPNYIGRKKELSWGRKIQNFFARKLAYLSYNKSEIIYVGILGNLLAIPFILIPCVIFIYLGWEGFGPYCIGCISPFASICAWMWFKGEW